MKDDRDKFEPASLPRLMKHIDIFEKEQQTGRHKTPVTHGPKDPCLGHVKAQSAWKRVPGGRAHARGAPRARQQPSPPRAARSAPGWSPRRPSATHLRRLASPGPHPNEAKAAPAPGPASPWRGPTDAGWARKSLAETTADAWLSAELPAQDPRGADTSTKMAAATP